MVYTGQQKRDYQTAWIKQRRQDWINSQGGVCAICGSNDRLEIDHIDSSTKLVNPTALWSKNQATRNAELAKCQVLCHDCHLTKTSEAVMTEHGTRSRYQRGCRCADCKAAQAQYLREYRSR